MNINTLPILSTEKKVFFGIGLLTLVLLVGGVWLITSQGTKEKAKLSKGLLGNKIADMGGTHVQRGATHESYNSNPPTSGPHWADGTAGPGIHDQEVADELQVHSLEHGAAILSYRSDLSSDQIKFLKDVFSKTSGKTILVPRKNLTPDVALTSWSHLEEITHVDASESAIQNIQKEIKDFMETNSDRGPEKAPI